MRQAWRTLRGIARSLRLYYSDAEFRGAMVHLYSRFVGRGDLVFDIGAHVGARVALFRRLGAQVVAVEPQPAMVGVLKLLYGRDSSVAIEPLAIGRRPGRLQLRLNIDNPTVATGSDAFVRAAHDAPGWVGQKWTKTIDVPLTTMDALIERYGAPAFVKIDVEGLEAEVLAGLSHAVPALSFEFTTIQPDIARTCIKRCAELGYSRYNVVIGESHLLLHRDWLSADEMASWLAALPLAANSGDVYALHRSRTCRSTAISASRDRAAGRRNCPHRR
jgi:FkbM family methyltransferase